MIEELREAWQLVSVKLAALAGILSGVFTANPELLLSIITVIPVDPLPRAIMALAVGGLVFLAPVVARLWPQDVKVKADGEQA